MLSNIDPKGTAAWRVLGGSAQTVYVPLASRLGRIRQPFFAVLVGFHRGLAFEA